MKIHAALLLLVFPGTLAGCGGAIPPVTTGTGDWPQYRADGGRTGYTPAGLPTTLALRWKRAGSAPAPAWTGRDTRMLFDYAFEPVVAGGTLFYGSSVDGAVYAVDTATGAERWRFFTGAPVRFAPVVWKDRVIVVSDDGYCYCLRTDSGKLVWKKRGGPEESMVLGNGRMMSRWPVRGGAVIHGDVLYFGAGIWPTEGIYLYAVNPENGDELWVNDDCGGLEMNQPHGGTWAKSGVSSQGYLAVAGNRLIVPTGRAVPAAFSRDDGTFDYFHLQEYGGGYQKTGFGGASVAAADSFLFIPCGHSHDLRKPIGARTALFLGDTGKLVSTDTIESRVFALSPDYLFYLDSRNAELKALPRHALIGNRGDGNDPRTASVHLNRDGDRLKLEGDRYLAAPAWSAAVGGSDAVSMIATGNAVVIGTENGAVSMVDVASHTTVWSAEVDGAPYGLAAAHGCLYVSTDAGSIYCFDGTRREKGAVISRIPANFPYGANEAAASAAEDILDGLNLKEGWCVDLGCGDGALSYELARRTNLTITAVDPDPENVGLARRKLTEAGLYGSRVTVHLGDPAQTPYPPSFANLVVSGRSVRGEPAGGLTKEASRLVRPYGGITALGKPGGVTVTVRGSLEGAGEWTHLYHDPSNTLTSDDTLVRGPLGILWFNDPDFPGPNRHGKGVGSLFGDGRLFVQGIDGIRAYDACNGTVLWEHYLEGIQNNNDQDSMLGANFTQGNWCYGNGKLFVRYEDPEGSPNDRYCLVLDAVTGALVDAFPAPAVSGANTWGYIAVSGGTL